MKMFAIAGLACIALVSPAFAEDPGTYVDVTASSGINVTPDGNRDDYGFGAAFRDYDNDGDMDLYVATGFGDPNKLYRNNGDGTFTDVDAPVVNSILNGRGVCWADYDNDGDADLFVANYKAANQLYRNNSNGTFTNRSNFAGVNDGTNDTNYHHSACWGDYDNDGWVDIFVCNYGILAVARANKLYHNNGDGTFTEVAATAGVADPNKPALACAWVDYDNDNDQDLFIAYDKQRGNTLYRNNGNGTFTDVAVASGTRLFMNAMGIGIGDYDHNGYMDLYVTNTTEGNAFHQNNGNGTFTNMAATLGITVNRIGWGTEFTDYNNDGELDLYVANWVSANPGTASENVLFRGAGGSFSDVTLATGCGDQRPTFATTMADINNDGYADIFNNNFGYPSRLYQCVPGSNNWIKIRTVGVQSNRDGIGARIRVYSSQLSQIRDVRSGSSYLSGLSHEVIFGLASIANIELIEVKWPSGAVDEFQNVPVNQTIQITEGGGLVTVPVFITRFDAEPAAGGVALSWDIVSDEPISGYRLYRRGETDDVDRALNDALLGAGERRFFDNTAVPGEPYTYALAVVKPDGSEVLSQRTQATALGLGLALRQNFPNPFNPSTTIEFVLPGAGAVDLAVYDASGARVRTLASGTSPAGVNRVDWDGRNDLGGRVSTGIYFYRLDTGRQVLTRKMVLLK